MADFKFNEALTQARRMLAEMSLFKKAAILTAVGVSLSVLGLLWDLSGKAEYEVLFSNLKTEDISQIAGALDKLKTPYQVQSETQSILVPGDAVLQTRLTLAKDGLPKFGGVGFEIFDQKSFGMTEFEQRLNYQRAMQGELTRTINDVEGVEDSRVHLVIPEKTVFAQARELPTASVVVKLTQGFKMPQSSVASVVNLVSASVAGLTPERVTVVDTAGQLLTPEAGEDMAGHRKKNDMEHSYEDKVRALLEPIVGPGKVQVQVTAELDFTAKETTEEKYDPDTIAVRSEKRVKSNETDSANAVGGVVGQQAQKQTTTPGKDRQEQQETVEYEISKQIQRVVSSTGDLKKLSVAVVVDGVTKLDDDGNPQYSARTAEELTNYEDLVKSAIGFQKERGDQIKVMNLAFQNLDQLFAVEGSGSFWNVFANKDSYRFYLGVMSQIVFVAILVGLGLFVVRPLLASFFQRSQAGAYGLAGTGQIDEKKQLLLQEAQIKTELQKQAVEDPEGMVGILRNWLS